MNQFERGGKPEKDRPEDSADGAQELGEIHENDELSASLEGLRNISSAIKENYPHTRAETRRRLRELEQPLLDAIMGDPECQELPSKAFPDFSIASYNKLFAVDGRNSTVFASSVKIGGRSIDLYARTDGTSIQYALTHSGDMLVASDKPDITMTEQRLAERDKLISNSWTLDAVVFHGEDIKSNEPTTKPLWFRGDVARTDTSIASLHARPGKKGQLRVKSAHYPDIDKNGGPEGNRYACNVFAGDLVRVLDMYLEGRRLRDEV